jgi:GR25 family glycosyltransferase involved in LPS biosynthesis
MRNVFIIITCIIILIIVVVVGVKQYIHHVNVQNYKSLLRYHKELPDVDTSKIDLPIFYINMDKHIDRKEFLTQQLIGVKDVSRVTGVVMNDELYSTYNTKLSKPELGCFLAHIKALEQFLKTDLKKAVIVEDDACFKLSSLWDQRLSETEDNIFFLGFGGSAYIVSRERAKFILDMFKKSNKNIPIHIDIWYQKLFDKEKNNNRKNLIYQYNISLPSTATNNPYRCMNEAVKIIKSWKK